MTPDFTLMLLIGILFALLVLSFVRWRFGWSDTLVFLIVVGGFSAGIDFLSAFAVQNYAYPGQSRLWVLSFSTPRR